MSRAIIAIGIICSLVVTILFFTPSSIPGFPNLQGDLNNTLVHGEKKRFRFFVFGDTEHDAGNLARLEAIFDAARERKPLFMVLLGDFVSIGTERSYRFFIDKV